MTMEKLVLLLLLTLLPFSSAFAEEKETTYDRIMRTGQLRCGYGITTPLIMVDPNTKKISGMAYDIVEEMGKALNLEIVWAEEVPWGSVSVALNSGRIDAMCSTLWASASRGKHIAFTRPVFYSTIDAFVRADDTRFDNNLERINQPDVRIAVEEGDSTEEMANLDFPKAQHVIKPQLAGDDYQFLSLLDNKADILFLSTAHMIDFNRKRPGEIKKVPLQRPLRIYRNTFGVGIHEQELQDILDTAIDQITDAGIVQRLLQKYDKDFPGAYIPRIKPYEYGVQK